MPAALTTGISTGVRIRMVGVMSIAVPTTITSTMMATISSVLLSITGRRSSTTLLGMSATVMSQAETIAAATRNMITAVVLAAATNTPYSCENFSSRYTTDDTKRA